MTGSLKKIDYLPPWTYHSEAFYLLEVERIFKKSWLLVGHISDFKQIGDYITFDSFRESAFIIKSSNNKIKAFHNVCRHRGSRLLSGIGNCPYLVTCPFHHWSYDLNGRLKNIPALDTFSDFDKNSHNLVALDLSIWQGFIFIRFISGGEDLNTKLKPIEHLVCCYHLENVLPVRNTKYKQSRPYNWKLIHDIDNEGYHVPAGHPSLQQLYGNHYEDRNIDGIACSFGYLNKKLARNWSVYHYQKILPEFSHLDGKSNRLWLYIGLYPSMVFGFYPDHVEYYMSIPNAYNQTIYSGASYALSDDRREVKIARYLSKRINNQTDVEDDSFVYNMHKNMKSSVFPKPTLSSLEKGVSDFHRYILTKLPVAHHINEPNFDQLDNLY